MNSREPVQLLGQILKTSHIIPRALKAMYMKHFKAPREFKRGDGYTHIPVQQISLKITNQCNLRCKTCGQWGETGYNLGKSAAELKSVVPVNRYLELVEEAKKEKPIYYIWGGEPLLYPGLFELTGAIKKNGSLLSLVTNATKLSGCVEEIVDQKWDALMFSLDGPEEIHDAIRGKKGTYKKVEEGIRLLREMRTQRGQRLPWIMALVTVSVDNAAWLDKIFEAGEALGIDCMIVYYSWFTDEKTGNLHTRLMEEKLGVTPTAWKGYLFDHDVDIQALEKSLKKIRSVKWSFPHLMIPDLKPGELGPYYSDLSHFFGYGPCISPWYVMEVMPNGDVAPCRDYPDYIAGNISESSLSDIWNGERYVKFRKTLKEAGGTFPICSRCCGLMGW